MHLKVTKARLSLLHSTQPTHAYFVASPRLKFVTHFRLPVAGVYWLVPSHASTIDKIGIIPRWHDQNIDSPKSAKHRVSANPRIGKHCPSWLMCTMPDHANVDIYYWPPRCSSFRTKLQRILWVGKACRCTLMNAYELQRRITPECFSFLRKIFELQFRKEVQVFVDGISQ